VHSACEPQTSGAGIAGIKEVFAKDAMTSHHHIKADNSVVFARNNLYNVVVVNGHLRSGLKLRGLK